MGACWLGTARRVLAVALALVVAACGGGGGGSGGGGDPGTGGLGPKAGADYYPLAVGDRWLYVDDGGTASKVRVTGTQAVSGGTAMAVETSSGGLTAVDLYLRTASGVTLVPSAGSDPIIAALVPLQILRLPIVAGDQWLLVDKTVSVVDLDGDGRADSVAVHAVATVVGFESLTTAAGSYTQVAHVQTVLTQTVSLSAVAQSVTVTSTSDDWYAPDIGPVRNLLAESGAGASDRTDTGITGWGLGTRRSENVAPTVTAKTPDAGSLSGGCCLALTLTFSEAMDLDALDPSGLHVTGPDGLPLAGTVRWQPDGRTALFSPAAPLVSGTYTAQVTNSPQDLVGNPLATGVSWQFAIDATGPGATPVIPLADAVEVPLDTKIVFTLDEDPDPATVVPGAVSLVSLTENSFVDIAVSRSGRTVTITPLAPLVTQGRYRVLVSTVSDKFGNRTAGVSWGFSADPGRFAAAQTLVTTAGVSAVAVGDVDGDGRADVVMATGFNFGSPDDYKIFVFAGQAGGTLAAPRRYATSGTYNADIDTLIVADLDGHGKNAVIAASVGNAIEIFRQQPDGSLAVSQILPTAASYVVRVADMNGDGRPDLVGRPFVGSAVQIWLQGADGSFGAPISVPVEANGFGDMAVGDINGDGRNDIVLTGNESLPGHEIGIVLQQSDGSFASPAYRATPTIANVEGLAIGDVNGDGRNDVVVSFPFDSSLGILLQDAQGQLGAFTTVRAATNASRLRIVDIDGDGRLDVVSSSWGGWPVALNRQRSDGTLGGAETFPLTDYGSDSPGILAIGDVDGDGLPDIVYGNGWLRQRPIPAAPPPAPLRAGKGHAARWGLGVPTPSATR